MKPWLRKTTLCLAIASISACSSTETTTAVPADGEEPVVQTPGENETPTDDDPVTPVDFGDLPNPTIPPVDLLAPPVPGPDITDPFGSLLETDSEASVAGGAPTQPKNLRVDLISNNWAEFSWAPSNDDGEVVAYNI